MSGKSTAAKRRGRPPKKGRLAGEKRDRSPTKEGQPTPSAGRGDPSPKNLDGVVRKMTLDD